MSATHSVHLIEGSSPAPLSPPGGNPHDGSAALHQHRAPLIPEPGIHRNVPMALYHAWEAASNSRLSKLRRSPAHLKSYLDEPKKDTTALVIGRAAHTSILEPEDFHRLFVVAETCEAIVAKSGLPCTNSGLAIDGDGRWKCGVHGKGLALDSSRFTLPGPAYVACQQMRTSVFERLTARGLLAGAGEIELSIVWVDAPTGLLCKARFDRWSETFKTIADLKTTQDAGVRAFERSIYEFGYHRQGAFYLDGAAAVGLSAEHFAIIPVEKEAPYASATYRLTEGAISGGREQLRPLLERYAECLANNTWPAYPDEVRDIALPDWAWKQIDEEVAA